MAPVVAYLDTSAFVKLLVREAESDALRSSLARWPVRASSAVLRTEAIRAVRRSGGDRDIGAARRLLRGVSLVHVDEQLLDRAGELEPRSMRSLDAIHVASALEIGSDLGAFLCYDERLSDAARSQGINVDSPA